MKHQESVSTLFTNDKPFMWNVNLKILSFPDELLCSYQSVKPVFAIFRSQLKCTAEQLRDSYDYAHLTREW